MLRKLWHFINPIAHLGDKKYSLWSPLISSIILYVLMEFVGNYLFHHPNDMGTAAVVFTFLLVMYFSFRFAVKGGLVATTVSIVYFSYFLYSRNVPLGEKEGAAVSAIILTILYFLITFLVGFLKKTLDDLFADEQGERKKAEHEKKRLQTLLEQLPVGVIIAEAPGGEIIGRNRRATQLLGSTENPITSLEEYYRKGAYSNGKEILPKEWPLAQAILKGKTISAQEITIITNKRKKRTLLFNANPILDGQGKVVSAVTTFSDITTQKDLEKQKDDFIAMASHEFKTPLTAAKIYAQTLLQNTSNQLLVSKLTKKINEQLDQLDSLITTMLDTTHMEQGKLVLKEESFILSDLALKILADLQDSTIHKIVVDWQTHEYMYGNRDRISQVFINLITNAIKFSPSDSRILVRSLKKNNSVVVSVQDFGIGISKGDQKHIFDKFYHASDHKTYPGLGLGLYISSEIIKQHRGRMWVESEIGKGSVFYFSLPIYNHLQEQGN